MLAKVSLLVATEPDTDARAVYLESLAVVHASLTLTGTAANLQLLLQRLAACVPQAEPTNPGIRRWLSLSLLGMGVYRDAAPWTLVRECQHALALCGQAGDSRLPLVIRGHYAELGFIDLGDLAGARQRLAAMQPLMEQSQEALFVPMWRHVFALVLKRRPLQSRF